MCLQAARAAFEPDRMASLMSFWPSCFAMRTWGRQAYGSAGWPPVTFRLSKKIRKVM